MLKAGLKFGPKRISLWLGLLLILLLTALSIFAAFIGAERAQRFFNSLPLAIYWIFFALLLIAALMSFHRLLHVRGLFLIHLGCVVILAGALLGSRAGLKIQDNLFGSDTIPAGQMTILKGATDTAVELDDGVIKQLPFAIKLDNFRIEYYLPGQLLIQSRDGIGFKIPAEQGLKYDLGADLGSVEIVRRFENFKLQIEDGKRIATDDPNGNPNPAIELRLKLPDGTEKTKYAFERFPGHVNPNDNLALFYRKTIQEYISDVEVIKDNKVVARKSIEVNKPLHFAGYLFYQQDYDHEAQRYSILRVTTDKHLAIVYLGYILLCSGAFWHLWFRHLFGDRVIED